MLFGLAIWQYQRGVYKQAVADRVAQSGLQTVSSAPSDWSQLTYRSAEMTGEWSAARSFLLENRVHKGRVGFEVLTPFRLQDGSLLMVNRGWVEGTEQALAPEPAIRTRVTGTVYIPDAGLTLGESILPEAMESGVWPKKALYLDLEAFETALNTKLAPAVLVLDQGAPASFVRIWQASVIPASKHFGYAVQWLGLAVTLLIYGAVWFRRRA